MAAGMLVHEVSVLVVILNAMRLLRSRPQDHTPATPAARVCMFNRTAAAPRAEKMTSIAA